MRFTRRRTRTVFLASALVLAASTTLSASPAGAITPNVTFTANLDESTILHNPGMGWAIYPWESSEHKLPRRPFWNITTNSNGTVTAKAAQPAYQHFLAKREASIFYIRVSWAEMEPTQHNYAWNNPNSDIAKAIVGAQANHLQLAFLVYPKGWGDQGTPDWVFQSSPSHPHAAVIDHCSAAHQAPQNPAVATSDPKTVLTGAATHGCVEPSKGLWEGLNQKYKWETDQAESFNKNPNYQDPHFRADFEQFIRAYGSQFNDPGHVAFVDGIALGTEGENVNLNLQYYPHLPAPGVQTYHNNFVWATRLYDGAFTKVLLTAGPGNFSPDDVLSVYRSRQYIDRQNNMGSTVWFTPPEVLAWNMAWPDQSGVTEDVWSADGQKTDAIFRTQILQDAAALHSNVLDLRSGAQWDSGGGRMLPDPDHPDRTFDGVNWFAVHGGYRLAPTTVKLSWNGTVSARWRNSGTGFLPNGQTQWNKKYRFAYALLDRHNKPVAGTVSVDNNLGNPQDDPGTLVDSQVHVATSHLRIPPGALLGFYHLAVAIVDTTNGNRPAIQLGLNPATSHVPATGAQADSNTAGWYDLGSVQL
jgi:hypothetical protein